MPAAAETQAATLQRFIDGWSDWTPDFLNCWSDDLTFSTLPFSYGKPARPRASLEPRYLLLMSTLKNLQVRKINPLFAFPNIITRNPDLGNE